MTHVRGILLGSVLVAMVPLAHAVTPGVTDVNGVLINPFTGLDVPVWRLVGRVNNGCTMTQLSRHWALTARHCQITDGAVFTNPLAVNGTGGSALVDCLFVPGTDATLCRLKNPENFQAPASYPPLAITPLEPVVDSKRNMSFPTNLKVGQFLGVGRSLPGFAAFIDGAYNLQGHNNAYPTVNFVTQLDSGDSGGAFYWISPTSHQAAYVGVMSAGLGMPMGIQHIEQTWIDWIVNRANALGYAPPTVVSTLQHYGGTPNDPPPMLPAPPQVAVSGQSATITWRTPALSATQSIVGYSVALGVGDRMDRSVVVSAGQGNASVQTGLPAGKQSVCVTPYNSIGMASPWVSQPRMSCTDFDTRAPQAVQGVLLTSKAASSAALRTIVASWQPPASSEVITGSYLVTQTITYAAGPKKTTTQTVVPTSTTSVVPAGVRVCVTVTAVSVSQVPSAASSSQCVNAN